MAFYTQVDNTTNLIAQSLIWYDTPPDDGPGSPSAYRWLPDNPPTPTLYETVTRVEPVAGDATEIAYDVQDIPYEDAAVIAKSYINSIREEKIAAGITYDGNVYDSDLAARANLTATLSTVNAGVSLPGGFVWRTADNVNIVHDVTSLTALAEAMFNHGNSCYAASWAHKAAIDALTTTAGIKVYDFDSGWPV